MMCQEKRVQDPDQTAPVRAHFRVQLANISKCQTASAFAGSLLTYGAKRRWYKTQDQLTNWTCHNKPSPWVSDTVRLKPVCSTTETTSSYNITILHKTILVVSNNIESGQTRRMRRLICAFVPHMPESQKFSRQALICQWNGTKTHLQLTFSQKYS